MTDFLLKERYNTLLELIVRINSGNDFEGILASIMESAKEMVGSEASSLMLLDKESGELIVSLPTGPAKASLSGKRIPKGKGFAGWVSTHNEPVMVHDAQSDPRFFGDEKSSSFKTNSILCVPLRNSTREVMGVLQAINKQGGAFTDEDLTLFSALADQAAVTIEKARLQREYLSKKVMESELNLAQTIQTGLLPRKSPSIAGFDIAGYNKPARQVGGDYFDYISHGEHLVVVIADVSGKGVGAGLVMTEVRAVLRTYFSQGAQVDLKSAMSHLNNTLYEDTPSDTFLTLFMMEVRPNSNEIHFVNAGHNPPFLLRKDGSIEYLVAGGPIVAAFPNLPFAQSTITLHEGETIVLYTDGITEAEREDGEQFDESRLEICLKSNPSENADTLIARIEQELDEFVSGAEQSDDITLIAVKRV